jgi:hypothetical protein
VKAIAMMCYLTLFLQSSTSPEIGCKSKELATYEYYAAQLDLVCVKWFLNKLKTLQNIIYMWALSKELASSHHSDA